jgi:predicted RNase H-like HicB family nuclease
LGAASTARGERRDGQMLRQYISAAMRRATYEILEDATLYGEIPGLRGVYADASTLEACRDELQEMLEGWIILGLQLGHQLPIIDGIELATDKVPA